MFVVGIVANCVERGTCRVRQLLFDFRYANNYVTVGFCVFTNVKLYKGVDVEG